MSERNPPIEFAFPDLRKWEKGAAPYIHVFESGMAGPTVMVAALTHGNEVSGAVVVDALLERGLRPRRGTLILSFNNIEAYHSFDPRTPFKSRMIDEDFNRTWGRLDQPATTVETRRAQVVRPFVERADFLLDLHSMHDDGVPLMLAGPLDKGVALARKVGAPVDIIRDAGHAAGMRMRDYGAFGDPGSPKNALLIETGQHWRASSVTVAKDVTARFLLETGAVEPADLPGDWKQPSPAQQRVVEVTHAIATKRGNFASARRFEGQEIIAKAGTILGHDDDEPVTTPYDNCVLVMPSSNRPLRPGVTVVRLGRLV
ncbi:Succinylglutamate desuccinylase / Aspartoacylase family protein [Enhydrobacter aerosaccus]|uniref:Succinylglutamate desuccinylase / Aspartoacylase family protein n=1 Tax=Enhydrobacter aerosaccus TaxID=225324 RepID=A0A1T4PIU1_9HYPH|nr:succinylglutamate desuccinylase/aspartoacylase family protein [Enhydrobacter aerosaccus]SJZ91495.1 Succinylglutamate desuccinylase / Aspartoacylase family protein [Enhydrobacter aerosaccus]